MSESSPLADELRSLADKVWKAGHKDVADPLHRYARILSAKERGTEGSNAKRTGRRTTAY